jgi:predicted CopG family antitoxin
MGSKMISVSEEAYQALLSEKRKNESFSDTILRLTKRFGRIMESFGKWDMSDEEEKKMEGELNKIWSS